MSDARRKCSDTYWKYLEDNSKVVSTWPEWLRGEQRSARSDQEIEPKASNGTRDAGTEKINPK